MSTPGVDLADYSFAFDDWRPPEGVSVLSIGWSRCLHLGLPFVEFHAWTDAGCVSVRCDPCSCRDAMAPYRAMVQFDLEKAIKKL